MPDHRVLPPVTLIAAPPPPERPVGAWPRSLETPLTHNDLIEAGRGAYLAWVEVAYGLVAVGCRLGFAATEAALRASASPWRRTGR